MDSPLPTPLLAVVGSFHRSCRLAKKTPLTMLAAHEMSLPGLGLCLVLLGPAWSRGYLPASSSVTPFCWPTCLLVSPAVG